MRSFVRGCGLLALAVLLLLTLASLFVPSRTPVFGGSPFSSHPMTVVVFPSSSSSVIGGPSLSASFVDRVLTAYGSPASWQVGAWDWFRLLTYEYLPRGLSTVQAIVPVYAPASDGNTPASYIAAVFQAVSTWHAGRVRV